MPDPRAAISFEGISPVIVTVEHNGTIVFSRSEDGGAAQVGLAVMLDSDGTVSTVADGEIVFGKLLSVGPDGYCSVQIAGGMTLPGGSSATLTAGTRIEGDLSGSDEGYIQTESDAAPPVGRGTIIDSSTATAVQVIL